LPIAAAADYVDGGDVEPREPACVADRASERPSQAVENAAHECRARGRDRLIRCAAMGVDPFRHVAGRHKPRLVDVDDGAASRQFGGGSEQLGEIDRPAFTFPGPHRFLEEPQTHHVPVIPDPAVYAQLVREVGLLARLATNR
jgi:hypothetical protein